VSSRGDDHCCGDGIVAQTEGEFGHSLRQSSKVIFSAGHTVLYIAVG
jgi:hypothetical protein